MKMSVIDIKFSKFDNTPWGFRLAGGSDFPQPLTVIKVTEESLAECMGLKVGDVVVRLNDRPVASLTHGQAHEALVLAGNNFTLGVYRTAEAHQAVEAIEAEKIEPYAIPLEDLKPIEVVPLDDPCVLLTEPLTTESTNEEEEEEEKEEEETNVDINKEEKPVDFNSEIVPNKNLTDDEIAQLILEEEELLEAGNQAVLGVNFKKLRPRAPLLKESKVLEELQTIALEEPPKILELKHKSTFLQKPDRPVPLEKKINETNNGQCDGYKVVIRKQSKKTVTERLLQKGILTPDNLKQIPEPIYIDDSTINNPESTIKTTNNSQENQLNEDNNEPCIEKLVEQVNKSVEECDSKCQTPENSCQQEDKENYEKEEEEEEEKDEDDNNKYINSEPTPIIFDKVKVQELISTEISLEKQLENVQNQLLALKQLPSEIENHLRIVSEQLHKIMELSGVQNGLQTGSSRSSSDKVVENNVEEDKSTKEDTDEDHSQSEKEDTSACRDTPISSTMMSDEPPIIIEPELEEIEPPETKELEVTLQDEDHRVKKFIASYETRVFRSREPSPAPSHGSYEPDPNLSPKDQVIQELKHRGGRRQSKDLWPQAKQLELTYGRRWRCPNDFFNDDMIAEVLSGQAEVIRGRALGVNFKKYEKEWLPNYDHLMNSSVYKMLHKMEKEPRTGIPARPSKVPAAEDILERVNTPA